MRVDRSKAKLELQGEDGDRLVVQYDNMGEPFREGISLALKQEYATEVSVFLEESEARQLRDLLNMLYPKSEHKPKGASFGM